MMCIAVLGISAEVVINKTLKSQKADLLEEGKSIWFGLLLGFQSSELWTLA